MEPSDEPTPRAVTPAELDALDALGKAVAWEVGGHTVNLTNLDKVLFPESGLHQARPRALLRDDRAG